MRDVNTMLTLARQLLQQTSVSAVTILISTMDLALGGSTTLARVSCHALHVQSIGPYEINEPGGCQGYTASH